MCKSLIIFIILLSIFVMLNIFALTQLLLDFFFAKMNAFIHYFFARSIVLCTSAQNVFAKKVL